MTDTMPLAGIHCTHNPGHREFIPFKELGENNLPLPYNTSDWVECIKLLGHDTVRLSVCSTSTSRPPQDASLQQVAGTATVRYGSGTAFLMSMAQWSSNPSTWACKIITAAHVVFDDSEAKNTVVEFFYDDEEDSRLHVIRARGTRVLRVDVAGNRCAFECITHAAGLLPKLVACKNARNAVVTKLARIHSTLGHLTNRPDLVVVISHPHGKAKHVSVGHLVNMPTDGTIRFVLGGSGVARQQRVMACLVEYTAATCPGSGGGSVSVLGRDHHVTVAFAPHSATGQKHNLSGMGWTARIDDCDHLTLTREQ